MAASSYSYEEKEKAALKLLGSMDQSMRMSYGMTIEELDRDIREKTGLGVKFVENFDPDLIPEGFYSLGIGPIVALLVFLIGFMLFVFLKSY